MLWYIVGAVAFFMLLVIAGTLSFKFLAVLFGLTALVMALFLQSQGKDPKMALGVAGVSLLVAFLFNVGWTTVVGIAIVGFALLRYTHFKKESVWLLVLALGLLVVLLGQYFTLNVLGIAP